MRGSGSQGCAATGAIAGNRMARRIPIRNAFPSFFVQRTTFLYTRHGNLPLVVDMLGRQQTYAIARACLGILDKTGLLARNGSTVSGLPRRTVMQCKRAG